MLHAKFQDHMTLLVLVKIFKGSPYMGVGPFILIFISPIQRKLHIKSGFDWPSGFQEEDNRK